jgi:hypothetical protein
MIHARVGPPGSQQLVYKAYPGLGGNSVCTASCTYYPRSHLHVQGTVCTGGVYNKVVLKRIKTAVEVSRVPG